MRLSIAAAIVALSAMVSAEACCAHSDAAEITFQHFTGIDPRPLPMGHAEIAEAVAKLLLGSAGKRSTSSASHARVCAASVEMKRVDRTKWTSPPASMLATTGL
jgi:hypothetical protein